MTDETPLEAVNLSEEETSSNVIVFGKKNKEDDPEPIEFTIDNFLENITKNKDDIENFFFLGLNKDGNSTISAKADNNLHLHWMLKRFITHLEMHLYG